MTIMRDEIFEQAGIVARLAADPRPFRAAAREARASGAEIAEKHLGMHAFEQPVGMLFAAAVVAFLWKNQPYRRRG